MLSLLGQLFKFARVNKKYWMLPVIIILLAFGGVILIGQTGTVAPFIYALF